MGRFGDRSRAHVAVVLTCLAPAGCPDPAVQEDESTSDGSEGGAEPPTTGSDGPPPLPDPPEDPDDDADSDGRGSVFIVEPDGGAEECDIWNNDCPQGEKCMPWADDGGNSWNATKCTPIAENPGQIGDPCTVVGSAVSGQDDCVEGAMCWAVDAGTRAGYCIAFCQPNADNATCDDPETVCLLAAESSVPVCLPLCSPFVGDCPTDREVCVSRGQDFRCEPDASGEEGAWGDPCALVGACDPGLFCASPSQVPGCMTSGCCSEFCDINLGDSQCTGFAEGQQCLPWWNENESPSPRWADVGFCGVPQ